jgi:hypothetical protein
MVFREEVKGVATEGMRQDTEFLPLVSLPPVPPGPEVPVCVRVDDFEVTASKKDKTRWPDQSKLRAHRRRECWRWGAIACGTFLCVLLAVGFAVTVSQMSLDTSSVTHVLVNASFPHAS